MNKSLIYTVIVIIIIGVIIAIFFIPSKQKDFTIKDPNLCSNIKDAEERDNCLNNIAINLGNEEACNFLSENKDRCLELVAAGFDKFYLCEQIQDKNSRANCLLAQNQNKGFEACEALGSSIGAGDIPREVEGVPAEENQEQKRLIIDSCYINVFLNQDIKQESCNLISDDNLRIYCQAVTGRNPSVCNSVEDDVIFSKVICVTEVARKLDDKNVCGTLSIKEDIQQCKNNLEATL